MFDTNTKQSIQSAVTNDGVICYPTEGVWGLGCHPQSLSAFNRILHIKKRDPHKGVILVASDINQLKSYINISQEMRQKLSDYWPGFVTCLLPKSSQCPNHISGDSDYVAVRLSAYPPLTSLCQVANTALVSTSANISNQAPVNSLDEAKALFGETVDYYLDQPLGGERRPSRIIRLRDDCVEIVRA